MQSSLPATNNWHYVSISKSKGNLYTWKNKAGIEWDLILIGEESGGVVTFKVGRSVPTTNTNTKTKTRQRQDKGKDNDKDKGMSLSRWVTTVATRRMATLRPGSLPKEIQ